jgi:hypothetical protein
LKEYLDCSIGLQSTIAPVLQDVFGKQFGTPESVMPQSELYAAHSKCTLFTAPQALILDQINVSPIVLIKYTYEQLANHKPIDSVWLRQHKTLDVITLFHKPSLAASTRVMNLLRTARATVSETATEDQASDHTHHANAQRRGEFELDITEAAPTTDQLRNILDYVGPGVKPGDIIRGARDRADALKRLTDSGGDHFVRPLVS